MRKIILFIMLIPMIQTTGQSGQLLSNELIDIVKVVQSEPLTIEHWEITYRDTINKSEVKPFMQLFQDKNNVTKEVKEDHIIYSVEEVTKQSNMNLTYDLIIPNNTYDARFTVTLSGQGWHEMYKNDLIQQEHHLSKRFFIKSPSIFTCLSASDSAIMKNGISMNKMSNKFNLLHSFTQLDNNKDSKYIGDTYGYNPQWKNKLVSESNPINIQIALQQDEDKINFVTIGTPIILNEY